ncbi:MAG TPA: hypothetical protein VLK84_02785 [Longimicrobium sp.]|nr:hypothetical protein [Longimicrobium sp.]
MRKMKLDIDQLAVDSFSIKDGDTDGRGTVHGNQITRFCSAINSCLPDTCSFSCDGSCVNGQQVC